MESMLHPQTLLCYERNGAPLSQEHGAPLRLVIPVKYGVKNIKRIGTIRYCTQRPADYWAGEVMTGTSDFSCNNPNHTKEQQSMTRRIAILVMAMGMSLGLAKRVTTIALARPQDDKMHSDDKMKDDKMAGDKMAGDKMSKKSKKHKKDKMADDKMKDDKMKDDKMEEHKN